MGLRLKSRAKTVRWQDAIQLLPPEKIEEMVSEEPSKVENQEEVLEDVAQKEIPSTTAEDRELQQGDIVSFEGNLFVVDHVEDNLVVASNPSMEVTTSPETLSYIDTIVDISPNDLVGKIVENRSTGIREVVVGWGKYGWPHDITYITLGNSGRVDFNIFKVLFKIEKSS